jgi:uncharacterized protein (TIGR03083 family)
VIFPGEAAYRTERAAFVETLSSLTDAEFDDGRTLCEGWAPRDVLAHLLGIDESPQEYVKAIGHVGRANARIVEQGRQTSRSELMERARRWADSPSQLNLAFAWALLGDLGIHHQDVVRGLGRVRQPPSDVSAAILREGCLLGVARLARHRIEPTDGGVPLGLPSRPVVRGPREALGMWLSGRDGIEPELEFVGARAGMSAS